MKWYVFETYYTEPVKMKSQSRGIDLFGQYEAGKIDEDYQWKW